MSKEYRDLYANRDAKVQERHSGQEWAKGYSHSLNLISFLITAYGGLRFIIEIANSILVVLKRFNTSNKKYQGTVSLVRGGLPAIILISELISLIRRYYRERSCKNTVSNENVEKSREFLGIKDDKIIIDNYSFLVGAEVTRWLLKRPKTESFKILGYFQYDTLQNLVDTYKEDDTTLITLFEFEGVKFVWMLRMFKSTEGGLNVRVSDVYTAISNLHKLNDLKYRIYKEFIQHFDFANNVLQLSPSGLSTFPRQVVVEEPKQYNIKKLAVEIRKILKRGKKRGYALVGLPGTGKSTIIHCLESNITEYPIVYICSDCFNGPTAVKEAFETLRYIQPCIGVIEDLDACGLKDKHQTLGELLEQIDDVDNKLNIVLLSAINDTSLVHYSLINRPGRFDEVIMVKTPQDIDEIYGIMKCRYLKNKNSDTEIIKDFITFGDIDKALMGEVLSRKYTQADICEIIEKALLLDNFVTNASLINSTKNLEESKQALRECSFGGSDPFKYEESCAPRCEDAACS